MSIEVNNSTSILEVEEKLNNLVTELKTSLVRVSSSKNNLEVKETLNYLEFVTKNIELVVQNPSILLEVTRQATNVIEVTPKEQILKLGNNYTNLIKIETKNYLLEVIPSYSPPKDEDEAQIMYTKRTDFVGDTVIYKGVASPGASETDAIWRISKITIDEAGGGDITEQFAGGTDNFVHAWSDRLSLTYT